MTQNKYYITFDGENVGYRYFDHVLSDRERKNAAIEYAKENGISAAGVKFIFSPFRKISPPERTLKGNKWLVQTKIDGVLAKHVFETQADALRFFNNF